MPIKDWIATTDLPDPLDVVISPGRRTPYIHCIDFRAANSISVLSQRVNRMLEGSQCDADTNLGYVHTISGSWHDKGA